MFELVGGVLLAIAIIVLFEAFYEWRGRARRRARMGARPDTLARPREEAA